MKTTKFGFVHNDMDDEFKNSIICAYNNNELEEVIYLIRHALAKNNIEPTKSNALHSLKQMKERLPLISSLHIDEIKDQIL